VPSAACPWTRAFQLPGKDVSKKKELSGKRVEAWSTPSTAGRKCSESFQHGAGHMCGHVAPGRNRTNALRSAGAKPNRQLPRVEITGDKNSFGFSFTFLVG
jgi:hypothetical protein